MVRGGVVAIERRDVCLVLTARHVIWRQELFRTWRFYSPNFISPKGRNHRYRITLDLCEAAIGRPSLSWWECQVEKRSSLVITYALCYRPACSPFRRGPPALLQLSTASRQHPTSPALPCLGPSVRTAESGCFCSPHVLNLRCSDAYPP